MRQLLTPPPPPLPRGSIGDDQLQYLPLADPPGLSSLSRLYLHGNSIGALTCASLGRGLPNCSALQLLWLQHCSIRDSDLCLLSEGLKALSHLHTLDLSVNRLTDACVPCLASFLPHMRSLLSLRSTATSRPPAATASHPPPPPPPPYSPQPAAQCAVFESTRTPASRFPLNDSAARAQSRRARRAGHGGRKAPNTELLL